MRFASPDILWLLIPAALFSLWHVFVSFKRIKNAEDLFDPQASSKMKIMFLKNFAGVKFLLFSMSVIFVVFALARPQGKPVETEEETSGIDIMVLCDVSSSMAAQDVKPDRMTAVKKGLINFVSNLSGDRIGMVSFAGIDFVQCPLTNDYDAFSMIVESLEPGMLAKDGTNIGAAIRSGVNRLKEKGGKSRILMLITDGESNQGESPQSAAKYAAENGIRIYTIGVGTVNGGKIPEGRDIWGRTYYKIYRGEEVISKLDETELRSIAQITGGSFSRLDNAGAFLKIAFDIRTMEENKSKIKRNTLYEENYIYPLIVSIVMMCLSILIPARKFWAN